MTVMPNMMQNSDSALPPALVAALPKDPYEQLDIARKITSMAVSSRVGVLEAEVNGLRQKLAERDMAISTLQGRVSELQYDLQQASTRISSVLEEQDNLAQEKAALEASVKKLTRDVGKLETFKKALMHSLQDDDESPIPAVIEAKRSIPDIEVKKSTPIVESKKLTPVATSPVSFVAPEPDTKSKSTSSQIFPVTPSSLTPGLSPSRSSRGHSASNSPKSRSIAVSPTKRQPTKGSSAATSPIKSRSKSISSAKEPSKVSSKWQSISDGRLSLPSSLPASKHATAPNSPPQIARTARVDGKEFFRQARNRLSYEQFSAFLANIKELNAHHQTREETLKKANDIFGPDNADLYESFDGLLSRHLPGET